MIDFIIDNFEIVLFILIVVGLFFAKQLRRLPTWILLPKWLTKVRFKFTLAYTLTILAWFSFATLQGMDMLAYTKFKQTSLSKGASLHHK